MKEEIKRKPIIVKFLQLIHPKYSTCYICGLPWSNCKKHVVEYSKRRGMFVVCEYCWQNNDLDKLIEATKNLYSEWCKNWCEFGLRRTCQLGDLYRAVELDKTGEIKLFKKNKNERRNS